MRKRLADGNLHFHSTGSVQKPGDPLGASLEETRVAQLAFLDPLERPSSPKLKQLGNLHFLSPSSTQRRRRRTASVAMNPSTGTDLQTPGSHLRRKESVKFDFPFYNELPHTARLYTDLWQLSLRIPPLRRWSDMSFTAHLFCFFCITRHTKNFGGKPGHCNSRD